MAETLASTLSHLGVAGTAAADGALSPLLFTALECDRPLAASTCYSMAGIDLVIVGRGSRRRAERRTERKRQQLEIKVPDPWMSSAHAHLERLAGRWMLKDAGSKNGTILRGSRCTAAAELRDGDVFELGHTLFLFRAAAPPPRPAKIDLDGAELDDPRPELATFVAGFYRQVEALGAIVKAAVPVLVLGETGTGKEAVARAIHELSGRGGRFVPVNCAAIPDTLVESELFGHRSGAFSGATEDRPGLIQSADGGTLLLDEIGDLSLSAQAAMLRVLQEHEVVPIGMWRAVKVDLRVVAATHCDLEALVREGRFRSDLLARLAGFRVTLPPLRERREDLGLIVRTILRRTASGGRGITLAVEAARALFQHDWPRNIRELEQALLAAAALADEGRIDLDHLPHAVRAPAASPAPLAEPALAAEAEPRRRSDLQDLLREHEGNVSAVARALGKDRALVHRWLKRYKLDPGAFRR